MFHSSLTYQDYIPVWNELSADHQKILIENTTFFSFKKGAVVFDSAIKNPGLVMVKSGRLRVFMISDAGREITLRKLIAGDSCLFTIAHLFISEDLNFVIEAEEDTELYIILDGAVQQVLDNSTAFANYAHRFLTERVSDCFSLIDEILWQRIDKRIATFLLDEISLQGTTRLALTHEGIANNLGKSREVITRSLQDLQKKGFITTSRGFVEVLDESALRHFADTLG